MPNPTTPNPMSTPVDERWERVRYHVWAPIHQRPETGCEGCEAIDSLAAEHDRLIKENEGLRAGLEDAARDIEGWNMFIGSGALKAIARRARAALQEEQG